MRHVLLRNLMDAFEEARELALEASQQYEEALSCEPTTSTNKRKKKKRTISQVMADIPDPQTVIFDPLCIPSKHPPILNLPSSIDADDPYALFTLFWPEKLWTTITTNTNLYAVQKRMSSTAERQSPWHETCPSELKIFVGILIYMGLYRCYTEHQYWRNDLSSGPLHTCALFMGLKRFRL